MTKTYVKDIVLSAIMMWHRAARIQAFSFLCIFVPGSENFTAGTFAPVELS